jgi:hypothetical protein
VTRIASGDAGPCLSVVDDITPKRKVARIVEGR